MFLSFSATAYGEVYSVDYQTLTYASFEEKMLRLANNDRALVKNGDLSIASYGATPEQLDYTLGLANTLRNSVRDIFVYQGPDNDNNTSTFRLDILGRHGLKQSLQAENYNNLDEFQIAANREANKIHAALSEIETGIIYNESIIIPSSIAKADPNQIVTVCDRLAANPWDENRVTKGTTFNKNKNPLEAITACKNAVASNPNNPRLQYQYARTLNWDKQYNAAFKWAKISADKSYSAANFLMGINYHSGLGVEKDIKKACDLYRSAAEDGSALGYFYSGQCHSAGLADGKVSQYDARYLYGQAAKKELAEASYALGVFDLYGIANDRKKDSERAFKHFQKAERLGIKKATQRINSIWCETLYPDSCKTLNENLDSAKEGDKESQLLIASLYEKHGRRGNWRSKYWYEKAATDNDSETLVKLARAYAASKPDRQKSIEYYEKALKAGSLEAAYTLGTSYFYGHLGLNKDLNKGAALYRMAAKGGYGFKLGPYFYSKNFETFDNLQFKDVRKKIDPAALHNRIIKDCLVIKTNTTKCKNTLVLVVYSDNKEWVKNALRTATILEEFGIPTLTFWSTPKNFGLAKESIYSFTSGSSMENVNGDFATTLIQSAEVYSAFTSRFWPGTDRKYEFDDFSLRSTAAEVLGEPPPVWQSVTQRGIYDLPELIKSAAYVAKKRVK